MRCAYGANKSYSGGGGFGPGLNRRKCVKCPQVGQNHWKTGVEAWINRHVELYYITTCLSNKKSAQAAAKWLVQSGALTQFRAIKAMDTEDISGYQPFQSLEDW